MSEVLETVKRAISHREACMPDQKAQASVIDNPTSQTNGSRKESTHPEAMNMIHKDEWEHILRDLDLFNTFSLEVFVHDWPTKSALECSIQCIRDLLNNYRLPVHIRFHERQVQKVHFRDL
jgi:hypothetical protein